MADFNSVNDLVNHIQKNIYTQQLGVSGMNMLQIVEQQTGILMQYIKDEIAIYKASYTPVEGGYDRTGAWEDSLRIEPPKIEGNEIVCYISFNDNIMHPSLWGGEDGNVSWLMEVGWNIEEKVHRHIPYLTEHPATHYIKNAVDKFNISNPYGLYINVYHDGELYL